MRPGQSSKTRRLNGAIGDGAKPYRGSDIEYRRGPARRILNYRAMGRSVRPMIRCATICLLVFAAGTAQAACYADYKAKKDNPLRLHYGVVQLTDGACGNPGQAQAEVSAKVARGGWTLLNVVSTFSDGGLNQRKASAGEFFLRF